MNQLTVRLALMAALVFSVVAFNGYLENGPKLRNNTATALKQFDGKTPATAGGFEVEGGWVSYQVIYMGEALMLALVFSYLFSKPIYRLLFGKKRPSTLRGFRE